MKVEYVGSLETAVPSASATGVKTGTVLTVSETVAAALLVISQSWKPADAEAEALTPGFGELVLSSPQSIDAFNGALAYTGGVVVTEAGMRYRSLYASVGETPSLAVWCWQRIGIVTREGMEAQVQATQAEASTPNLNLGEGAGASLKPKSESNTLYGTQAGASISTGKYNAAFGYFALGALKTGASNVAVGNSAGLEQTTGTGNTLLGANAGREGNGSNNSYVGWRAGEHATGSGNVFIGKEAGSEEEGSNKLHVGIGINTAAYLIRGDFANTEIGFLGAAPVKRAAHPTTLAEVITILKNLGFCE